MPINDGFFSATLISWSIRCLSVDVRFTMSIFNLVVARATAWLNPLSYNKPSCFSSHVFELRPDFNLYVSRFYHESLLQGQHGRGRRQLVQAKLLKVSCFLSFLLLRKVFNLILCAFKSLMVIS